MSCPYKSEGDALLWLLVATLVAALLFSSGDRHDPSPDAATASVTSESGEEVNRSLRPERD